MTVDVFVRPSATPGELPGGDGSAANPFHSVRTGIITADANGGGTVHLFGGHFVESVALTEVGNPDNPIVVRPVEGSGEVFIDSCLPEFLDPQAPGHWEPVDPADGGAPEEYRSVGHFAPRPVNKGAFYDELAHTRLVSYAEVDDLRSDNQLWFDGGSNIVWRSDPDSPGSFIPENRDNKPKRRPFVYMGPGIWFDPAGHRIHVRLAPTTNHIPNWPDFDPPESDPNQLDLALSTENSHAIFLKFSHNIQFQNLTLRFGNPDTVRLNSCSDIGFDHCRIRSGSRAVYLNTEGGRKNENIRIEHCEIDGGLPTWFFRSDRKDTYLRGPDGQPDATEAEVFEHKLGFGTSGVQISGEVGCVGVVVHHCEIVNAHDSYVFGYGMEFHHNWVHNLNDDGIAVSGVAETSEAKIYCNVLTQCLTALSFASNAVGPVYIYGNLIDIRQPTLSKRPPAAGVSDSLKQGHLFKDGANEGPIDLFHNTLLVRDPGLLGDDLGAVNRVGFAYFSTIGSSEPRTAFNNIMVGIFTPGTVKPIAFLAPKAFITETNGNTFFRIPQNDPTHQFEVHYKNVIVEERNFADLKEYRQHYWPPDGIGGYEQDSTDDVNPGFIWFDSATGTPLADDDLRLDPTIDTAAAVELSAELRSMYVAATGTDPANRGCYPSTGTPLRVGVDGRRVFPPT